MTESTLQDFLVKRGELGTTRWAPAQTRPDEALQAGEAILKVDRYAFTSNNITYGLVGELARYWEFFPAEQPWGRIPVWGYADVTASRVPELPEGERIFGYLPMSPYLKVQPTQITAHAFVDASEHRRTLPATYQQYMRAPNPKEDGRLEDTRSLLQPLAGTGLLIDSWLVDNQIFGARQILLGSASSKTALATAFMLARRAGRDYQIIGLTSAGNRAFCERTGYYDRVVEYSELRSLPPDVQSVYVDMSGAANIRRDVHEHFRDALRFSSLVGITHGVVPAPAELPGPAPLMFFAPAVIDKLVSTLGGAELQARFREANAAFFASARSWLEIQRLIGSAAIETCYHRVRNGQVDPKHGLILSL